MQKGKRVDMIVIDDYNDVERVHSEEHEKLMKYWWGEKAKIKFSEPTNKIAAEIDKIMTRAHVCGPVSVSIPMRHLNGMNALALSKYTEKP